MNMDICILSDMSNFMFIEYIFYDNINTLDVLYLFLIFGIHNSLDLIRFICSDFTVNTYSHIF